MEKRQTRYLEGVVSLRTWGFKSPPAHQNLIRIQYMKIEPTNKIYLGDSSIDNAGRGVFASQDIKKDELIESCPIIYFTEKDYAFAKQTILLNYYFLNEEKNRSAIALGFGSLYNHSYRPNATYKKRLDDGLIDFVAINNISASEEITVNYNYGNPDDQKDLWIKGVPSYKTDNK